MRRLLIERNVIGKEIINEDKVNTNQPPLDWSKKASLLLDYIEGRGDLTTITRQLLGDPGPIQPSLENLDEQLLSTKSSDDVYLSVIDSLRRYTNFDTLLDTDLYLDVISQLIRNPQQNTYDTHDVLEELLDRLEIGHHSVTNKEVRGWCGAEPVSGHRQAGRRMVV